MSTIKVDTINTRTGTGNITFSRPIVADISNVTGTLPAISGAALTNLPAPADNSITLAKMAGGTDGQIITYDAAGDPVAIGPGTAGQVLTSAGPNLPQTFADAGGGGFIRLGGATFSGVASATIQPTGFSMDNSVSPIYDGYRLLISWETNNNAVDFRMRARRDPSSDPFLTSGYSWQTHGAYSGSAQIGYASNAGEWKIMSPLVSDNNPDSRIHIDMSMFRARDESSNDFIAVATWSWGHGVTATPKVGVVTLHHTYDHLNGLQIYASAGTSDGCWTMYGLKS